MKAMFVVNNQGDWAFLGVFDSSISEQHIKDSYTERDGQGNDIPRQFFVVDLPAVEDLRS